MKYEPHIASAIFCRVDFVHTFSARLGAAACHHRVDFRAKLSH